MLLVYSIVDEQSFEEMGRWLIEMKNNLGDNVVLHIVGTKSDVAAQDPSARKIPFERCIAYVADNLHPETVVTPPVTAGSASAINSLDGASKRSSAFWGQDLGWDCCHEISSSSGEGIEEVFRVITRKLVEQQQKKIGQEHASEIAIKSGVQRNQLDGLDGAYSDGHGSFRVGDKRRSWLGFPTPNIGIGDESDLGSAQKSKGKKGKCC